MKQLFYFVAMLLLSSCEKDQVTPEINPYDEFMENPEKNDGVQFSHFSTLASFSEDAWQVSSTESSATTILVNDTLIIPKPSDHFDFGGASVSVEFEDGSKITDFHIPQAFKFTKPELLEYNETVSASTIVEWEPDPKNSHPILIKVEINTLESGTDIEIKNQVYVENSGTYQLGDALFKNIHDGAKVMIYAWDYNYVLNDNKNFIHAYSLTCFYATYKKD